MQEYGALQSQILWLQQQQMWERVPSENTVYPCGPQVAGSPPLASALTPHSPEGGLRAPQTQNQLHDPERRLVDFPERFPGQQGGGFMHTRLTATLEKLEENTTSMT